MKLARYLASGVREVVRFDPEASQAVFSVWDRIEGDLVERAADDPDLHQCLSLGLWWTVVPSAVGPSLRLARDREGKQLLLTPQEDCARLGEEIREERLARSIAQHERQLLQHEQSLAEQRACEEAAARQKSEVERDALAAEVERLRAELGRRS